MGRKIPNKITGVNGKLQKVPEFCWPKFILSLKKSTNNWIQIPFLSPICFWGPQLKETFTALAAINLRFSRQKSCQSTHFAPTNTLWDFQNLQHLHIYSRLATLTHNFSGRWFIRRAENAQFILRAIFFNFAKVILRAWAYFLGVLNNEQNQIKPPQKNRRLFSSRKLFAFTMKDIQGSSDTMQLVSTYAGEMVSWWTGVYVW